MFFAKYSTNSLHQCRWQQIFQHEYVSLVWLRERGYNISKQLSSKLTYIPNAVFDDPTLCYCGFEKDASATECRFCSPPLRKKIKSSVSKGRINLGVPFYLSGFQVGDIIPSPGTKRRPRAEGPMARVLISTGV